MQQNESRGAFASARRIGDTVYVGLQNMAATAHGKPIEDQTHHAFQSLVDALQSQGLRMQDLMKLHTYYPYEGEGRDVTSYWERMTAVRLQYLANPGPAATALRVSGMQPGGPLIGVDGIGVDPATPRRRIMPEHAWDWSIPTPFSQGWLVGDKVYVGGQISADRKGKAVSPGELAPQVENTLEFIRHVLLDAGAGWDDVASIKVAYKCSGQDAASRATLHGILKQMEAVFPNRKPALVCFGVDLLYEGLLLEIDALAIKRPSRPLVIDGRDWAGRELGYPAAVQADRELCIAGQFAPGPAPLLAQLDASLDQVRQLLAMADGSVGDLAKLNVYCDAAALAQAGADAYGQVQARLAAFLKPGRTVVSVVAVPGLLNAAAKVQVDGLAVLGQPL